MLVCVRTQPFWPDTVCSYPLTLALIRYRLLLSDTVCFHARFWLCRRGRRGGAPAPTAVEVTAEEPRPKPTADEPTAGAGGRHGASSVDPRGPPPGGGWRTAGRPLRFPLRTRRRPRRRPVRRLVLMRTRRRRRWAEAEALASRTSTSSWISRSTRRISWPLPASTSSRRTSTPKRGTASLRVGEELARSVVVYQASSRRPTSRRRSVGACV